MSEQQVLADTIEGLLDVELSDDEQRTMFAALRDRPLPEGMTTRKFFQTMAHERFSAFLPDLAVDQYLQIYDYTFFPNFVFNALPGTIFGFAARPNGADPDSCIFDVISLQHPCGQQGKPVKRQKITDPDYHWGIALSQDWSNLERIQKGMHARTMKQTTLAAYQEQRVANRIKVIDQFFRNFGNKGDHHDGSSKNCRHP